MEILLCFVSSLILVLLIITLLGGWREMNAEDVAATLSVTVIFFLLLMFVNYVVGMFVSPPENYENTKEYDLHYLYRNGEIMEEMYEIDFDGNVLINNGIEQKYVSVDVVEYGCEENKLIYQKIENVEHEMPYKILFTYYDSRTVLQLKQKE